MSTPPDAPSPSAPEPEKIVPLNPQGLQRRRLLLKAAATGLPAVVTLISGRRAAAGTWENSCLRQNSMKSGRGAAGRCIKNGADPGDSYFRLPENAFPTGPSYPSSGTTSYDISGSGGTTVDADEWCIVYVDSSGNIATSGQGGGGYGAVGPGTNTDPDTGNGYYAVTDSCWSSFAN